MEFAADFVAFCGDFTNIEYWSILVGVRCNQVETEAFFFFFFTKRKLFIAQMMNVSPLSLTRDRKAISAGRELRGFECGIGTLK